MMRKITLKEAIENDRLAVFIDQNKDLAGNKERLDKAISDCMPEKPNPMRDIHKKRAR